VDERLVLKHPEPPTTRKIALLTKNITDAWVWYDDLHWFADALPAKACHFRLFILNGQCSMPERKEKKNRWRSSTSWPSNNLSYQRPEQYNCVCQTWTWWRGWLTLYLSGWVLSTEERRHIYFGVVLFSFNRTCINTMSRGNDSRSTSSNLPKRCYPSDETGCAWLISFSIWNTFIGFRTPLGGTKCICHYFPLFLRKTTALISTPNASTDYLRSMFCNFSARLAFSERSPVFPWIWLTRRLGWIHLLDQLTVPCGKLRITLAGGISPGKNSSPASSMFPARKDTKRARPFPRPHGALMAEKMENWSPNVWFRMNNTENTPLPNLAT
jgi:hypothetical protein